MSLTAQQAGSPQQLNLFVNGGWQDSRAAEHFEVRNPASEEVLAWVPDGTAEDVGAAVESASAAFREWRQTPPEERIQYLFKLKALLEERFEEIARLVTTENGKTLAESRGEVRRAVENVEVACGIPTLMQGYNLQGVAAGIDELMVREPLGVVAAITPFNFPAMIPFWFLPYAIACGNTFLLKPSERVPLTAQYIFELLEEVKLPAGVVSLVHGGKRAVDALLEHPEVRAISFVGSTPVAKLVYAGASARGKRVQCQGGAKNHVVIMPDADMEMTTRIVGESAFGCAGQRCLAVSAAVMVGEAQSSFREQMVAAAGAIRTGAGLDEKNQMGPLITQASKARVESLIEEAVRDGGTVLLDGRDSSISRGFFVKPTVLAGVPLNSTLTHTEVFGPVLSLISAASLDDAIAMVGHNPFGNAASIFTSSGAAARKFRYEVAAGNVGINIGVAAPMAYFPFSGWKDSFFGVLHAQGRDAVQFYTNEKVVIERWPKEWSRQF